MKNETELIVLAINLEIQKLKNSFDSKNEKFHRELTKNNIEFCKAFLQGQNDLLNEIESYLNLRRSKLALLNLDDENTSYEVDTDTNFSRDDIPF